MRDLGLNVDFAPLADVYQGGGIEQSRTFGGTPATVTTYAGAFLDGLQQHGIAGTLKTLTSCACAAIRTTPCLPLRIPRRSST